MHNDVPAGKNIPGEIWYNPFVCDLQPRSVIIEGSSRFDRDMVLPCEINAKCLPVSFRFIITGTRSGAGDISPIGFRGWNIVRRRIPIYLARGIIQKSFYRQPFGLLLQAKTKK